MDGAVSPLVDVERAFGTPSSESWRLRAATLLLSQREIFLRGMSAPHRLGASLEDARSVWCGVGLAARGLSVGLPVDMAGMLIALEMLRRELALERAQILIADENAVAAGWNALDVRRIARRMQARLEALSDALGGRVTISLASSLPGTSARHALASQVAASGKLGPYTALQIAQVEAMRRRGASLKLGWSLGRGIRDEVLCDELYQARVGRDVSFVYAVPGRSLDPRRPRACPYLCTDRATRLLVDDGERIGSKLAEAPAHARVGYARLLGKIMRGQAALAGSRCAMSAVDAIIELAQRVRREAPG